MKDIAIYDLLADLVGLPSVNPISQGTGEGAMVDYLAAWMRARGLDFHLQEAAPGRCNVLARIGPPSADALLLDAHMDTVGVGGWAKGDPFVLQREGSRFYGRGACDTKGSMVAFLATLDFFHRHPEQLARPLVFAATVDEENEQIGAHVLAGKLREWGVGEAIAGEPTLSDVVPRHKGVCRYKLSFFGKAAHGSTPDLGTNAIYATARMVTQLEGYASVLSRRFPEDPMKNGALNVGVIQGGIGFNVVPDECQVDVDRRLGVMESSESARRELEVMLAGYAGAKLEVCIEREPLRGLANQDLVEGLLAAAHKSEAPVISRDVSYMTNAVYYEAAGVPAVVFGPGDIAQAHKVDEYIEAGQIEKSVAILRAYLSR